MRILALLALLGVFLSSSAYAGTLTMVNGQVSWQPSKCSIPVVPKELMNIGSIKNADAMNAVVLKYNLYLADAKIAMHCLSSEAEHDSNKAAYTIAATAKENIDRLESSVNGLGAVLKNAER